MQEAVVKSNRKVAPIRNEDVQYIADGTDKKKSFIRRKYSFEIVSSMATARIAANQPGSWRETSRCSP